MKARTILASVVGGAVLTACVTVPTGPSVMVLPGSGKSYDQFMSDGASCRQFAQQGTGYATDQAVNQSAASAVGGSALGAAAGAIIGSASGNAGAGAAIGAGTGLLFGSAVGSNQAYGSSYALQRNYDMNYMQCMYARGHQVPMPAGYRSEQRASSLPPPPSGYGGNYAPPAGSYAPPGAPPANAGSPPPGTPPPVSSYPGRG